MRMFQALRRRLTLLYAGATLVLLALLGIGMVAWLNNQFTQAADAALYQRLVHEISDRQLPMPLMLGDYRITATDDEEQYDISVDQLSDFLPTTMPSFAATFLRNPASASTYAIAANPQQIAIRDGVNIPPVPLNTTGLLGAVQTENHIDIRTIHDRAGADIRVLSYYLPQNHIAYIQVGRPLSDYQLLQQQLLMSLAVIAILAVIGVSLLSWLLSGYLVAPTARAYEQQRRFITHASHELRTPLSIVRASAEMAQLDIEATHPAAPWIADIINENRHMTTIIENLLTIARTQQRLATVPRYDLVPLIQKTIITTQQHAPQRHITSNCDDTAFFCTSDPNYVTHILQILLDNAIAHTADTCHINVQLRFGAGHCEIMVCDDGNGIPADQVSQIFEPFVSIDRGTSHRGSGIGLSIAQSFCNAINATVRYHPNQPHGACFVVRLAE
jgi:signal transduction histidine kinase